MITCSKQYRNLPAAHRQPNHSGHCSLIHGHNWGFDIKFGTEQLDANKFVVDFGKLKFVKEWLEELFDHTLLLNEDDPALAYLTDGLCEPGYNVLKFPFARIKVVPNCGAEALAEYVATNIDALLREHGLGHVHVVAVVCHEDDKNSAEWLLAGTNDLNLTESVYDV